MKFSQRMGLVPVRSAIQGRSLDPVTRTRLWNAFVRHVPEYEYDPLNTWEESWQAGLFRLLWSEVFGYNLDEMENQQYGRTYVKKAFLGGQWDQPFQLLETMFTSSYVRYMSGFKPEVLRILEEEMVGFKWIDNMFVEVTDETEIAAIEDALTTTGTDKFAPARAHLRTAIQLLSDRKQPDYRNSIKESISAVEAAAQILTGNSNAELGDALKLLRSRGPIHGAFEAALKKLYGWTSDDQGIRHALSDEPTLDASDAKFMLVACSAFVVYLIQKIA